MSDFPSEKNWAVLKGQYTARPVDSGVVTAAELAAPDPLPLVASEGVWTVPSGITQVGVEYWGDSK